VASYKTKVTSLNANELYTEAGKGTILTAQGGPLGVFYGLKTEGIFATDAEAAASGLKRYFSNGDVKNFRAGDIRFKDFNGDGYIDDSDRTVIGNPSPDFTGMISNNIQWKNIALEAIITYSYGNDVYNYLRSDLESMSNTNNQTLAVRNRWRTEGHVTNVPRADYGDPMGNGNFSDRWIEDGSFICLKSLSLSYKLPVKRVLKSFSVFATGYNLLTLTKYLGYNPEFSASGSPFQQGIDYGLQPLSSSFIVGVRMGL
jgi:hypothetical protein